MSAHDVIFVDCVEMAKQHFRPPVSYHSS